MFLFTRAEHVYVSSSLVKEIAANGGDTSLYVSHHVRDALNKKLRPSVDPSDGGGKKLG